MKKILGILAAVAFLLVLIATGALLWKKSRTKPVVFRTESPYTTDIVKKAVATGSVVPRREVAVKPLVSGIIDALQAEPGKIVKQGDLVARVRVIPDMVQLNSAESRVNTARITLGNTESEYERRQQLHQDGLLSKEEFQTAEMSYARAREELAAAQANLEIVRTGAALRLGTTTTTLVPATIAGMVLDVPVEVGNSVIEANNFNDGTTIATIADMEDMIFEGKVDESEVGKIRPGMPLVLTIGAIEGQKFDATLEHIAPKGVEEEGAIQFEIRAAVKPSSSSSVFIRANYSASADIVLDRREDVLAIKESLLQFEGGKPYVEVEVAPQQFERREAELGLSDGIQVEILSGLTAEDKVKNPNPEAGAPEVAGNGQGAGQRRRRG